MAQPLLHLLLATSIVASAGASTATERGQWLRDEAAFPFRFGNEFDTHQQSRELNDGSLLGFLYLRFTETVTKDGYPVATHADCALVTDCVVGWTLRGKPARATFLYQPMHDHPVFVVGRARIPQPGAYVHFHWTGAVMLAPQQVFDGYLLQLTAVRRFCFVHHGAESVTAQDVCSAVGGVAIAAGTDAASHINILASASM